MKFIKTYAITLVICYIFMFFGGGLLFDFSKHFYVATAACALILAAFISVLLAQEEKIESLESRLKALEEKSNDTQ